MKKITLLSFAVAIIMASCQKNNLTDDENTSPILHRNCASQEVLEAQIKADPELEQRMSNFEKIIENNIKNNASARLVNGVIEIPVVVNVLYKSIGVSLLNPP